MLADIDCDKSFFASLIVALIAIAFDSTYVDQDDLPVVTSGTSRYYFTVHDYILLLTI